MYKKRKRKKEPLFSPPICICYIFEFKYFNYLYKNKNKKNKKNSLPHVKTTHSYPKILPF